MRWPHKQLDDGQLRQHVQEVADRVRRRGKSLHIPVVDLTGNSLTSKGVNVLCTVARDNGISIGELRLQANPELRDPEAMLDLLGDSLGKGDMRCICLSPSQISQEYFWNLLGVCCAKRPRPALAIFLDSKLEELEEVIEHAEKHDLKFERVSIFPGCPPPDVFDPESDTDVVLFIDH